MAFSQTKMYIEIAKDVIDAALAKQESVVNDPLDLLVLLAVAAQKGHHFVTVPCLHNNRPLVNQLSAIMPSQYVAKLLAADGMHYRWAAVKEKVLVYAVITYNENTQKNERMVVINPSTEGSFEPNLETLLLTENLMDAVFFRYLVKFFQREKNIGACNISFEPLHGGGNTTADVLYQKVEERKRFCLALTDSDRKLPEAEYGQTAKRLLHVIKTYQPFNCDVYVMDQVMEVENLIPRHVVFEYASGNGCKDVFACDPSFFDMKNGLTMNAVYKDNVCSYWQNMTVCGHVDFTHRDEAKCNAICRDDYERYIKEHGFCQTLLPGFGSDLLAICTCTPVNGIVQHPEIEDKLMNVRREELTTFQYNEWMKIGQMVFSWTCSLPKKRA